MRILRPFGLASASCLAWGVASISGCAPDEASYGRQSTVLYEGGDGGGGDDAVRDDASLDAPHQEDEEDRSDLIAAFDDEGRVVLLDPDADEVVERRAIAPGVGHAVADLAFDPFRDRLLAVVMPTPFEASTIVEIPVDDDRLGVPRELGWVTGEARVMPLPGGVVVASNADGPRVRLLRDDGERTLGRPVAEPLTWWLDARRRRISGLGAEAGAALVGFTLEVDATGSVAVAERRELGLVSEDARLVRGRTVTTLSDVREEPDDLVVHDDASGELAIIDGESGAPTVLMHRARALQGAARWGDAIVVSTSHPGAIVVRTRAAESVLDVPAGFEPATPFGRHDLVVAGGRLLAATREGIVAFVRTDGDDAALGDPLAERDWTFHGKRLRGPMAPIAR